MMENLNKTGGLIFSQRIMLAVVSKGVLREDAYKWVQRNAMARWLKGEDFRTNVEKDPDITKYLTKEEIDNCFDYQWFLRNVDMIMAVSVLNKQLILNLSNREEVFLCQQLL